MGMWFVVENLLLNSLCSGGCFRRVFSRLFVSTFVSTLYIGLYLLRSFLFPFLKIITILSFFHAVGIRLSDKHLEYSLASVFEMELSSLSHSSG